jgi:hypothetical protein
MAGIWTEDGFTHVLFQGVRWGSEVLLEQLKL